MRLNGWSRRAHSGNLHVVFARRKAIIIVRGLLFAIVYNAASIASDHLLTVNGSELSVQSVGREEDCMGKTFRVVVMVFLTSHLDGQGHYIYLHHLHFISLEFYEHATQIQGCSRAKIEKNISYLRTYAQNHPFVSCHTYSLILISNAHISYASVVRSWELESVPVLSFWPSG